jgi:hypothetical protein
MRGTASSVPFIREYPDMLKCYALSIQKGDNMRKKVARYTAPVPILRATDSSELSFPLEKDEDEIMAFATNDDGYYGIAVGNKTMDYDLYEWADEDGVYILIRRGVTAAVANSWLRNARTRVTPFNKE